jgi:hypothetical protein
VFTQTRIIKSAWLVVMAAILICGLIDYFGVQSQQLQFEVGLKYLVILSVLSLPLGPILLFVVVRLLGLRFSGIYELMEIWLLCLIGGYIQWFVLMPRIYQASKKKKVDAIEGPGKRGRSD